MYVKDKNLIPPQRKIYILKEKARDRGQNIVNKKCAFGWGRNEPRGVGQE